MYERFYNLRERPFSLSPDPDYLYLSRVHREALGYLRYGIEGHAGFVVITGEIGCGKTTLLQTMLRNLDRQTSVSRLVNTMLDARELVEAVMIDFGLDPGQGRSKPLLLRDLAQFLVDQRTAGRLALLVIDEAQNLSLSALEEVRMLSNLETEKSKLIQILLVGQPNLREVLARPELEQLRQRVTVSYHLQPLDIDETAAYVNHRLRRAAIGAPLEFSRSVTDVIHQYSAGIPRKINIIADAMLLFGYGEERHVIDITLTTEVIEELTSMGVLVGTQPARVGAAAQSAAASVAVPAAAGAATPAPAAASPETAVLTTTPSMSAAPVPATQAAAGGMTAATIRPTQTPVLHDGELHARESRLAERERQIAEKERVLKESYRLLRDVRTNPVTQPPWPPARPATDDKPAAAAAVSRASYEGATSSSHKVSREPLRAPEGFWTRLRRGLFGAGKPVVEDWRF
jgi:putative secretion ATPase (PEP-CTERM system associated)